MSKAKANTLQQKDSAVAKQRELEDSKKREAALERQKEREERERKRKEAEARHKREAAQRELDEKLRLERERKRADKVQQEAKAAASAIAAKPPPGLMSKANGARATAPGTTPAGTLKADVLPSTSLRKKRKKLDAMFSDDDDVSSSSSRKRPSQSSASPRKSAGQVRARGSGRPGQPSADPSNLSAKDRIRLGDFRADEKLQKVKRDNRTIEEIEADLRKKRDQTASSSTTGIAVPAPVNGFFAGRRTAHPAASASTAGASPGSVPGPSTESRGSKQPEGNSRPASSAAHNPRPSTSRDVISPPPGRSQAKPAAAPAGAIHPQSRLLPKAGRIPTPQGRRDGKVKTRVAASDDPDVARRKEIWRILNPHKANQVDYASDEVDDDDELSDDMEAGWDELEEENRRAEAIAKREDREELAREEQRAKEKELARKRKGR